MSKTPRPTLRIVGKAAGVSQMTVSLALRNSPRLRPETCERIQRLAEEMGYRPDPLLTKLMTHLRTGKASPKHEVIAWISNYRSREFRTDTFLSRLFSGAQERAAQLGYRLEEFSLNQRGITGKRLTSILRARAISGAIAAPLREGTRHLPIDWAYFASVAVGFSMLRPRIHRVAPHHYENMSDILRHAKRLGFRRIGFITSEELDKRVGGVWTAAFQAWQRSDSGRVPLPVLIEKILTPPVVQKWFKRYRPDAVVTDRHDVRKWIEDLGFPVPETTAIISPSLSGKTLTDAFTGIEELPELLGAAAVDLVSSHMNRSEYGIPKHPKTLLVGGVWFDGTTATKRSTQSLVTKVASGVFVEGKR